MPTSETEELILIYKTQLEKFGWNDFKNQSVEFLGYDSWILVWFNHETIDDGQDDNYFLKSFEEYCNRIEHQNYQLHPNERNTLMGAEDRWRWCGVDSTGNKTDPPCRCSYCKEQGMVRINH